MAQSVVGIAWAYPLKRQAAYSTPNPDADINQSHPCVSADFGEHTPNFSTNAEHYGKGHEFATRSATLSWDTVFRRQFHATSKIVGWGGAFHLGDVTTTSLGGGAYNHRMEYQDHNGVGYYGSSRQQPVFTIIERVSGYLVRMFPSMQIKAFERTGQLNDWAMLTLEMQGSGMMQRIAPSSYVFPDPTNEATGGEGKGLFRNASLLFESGVSGALQDTSCDVRSYRFRSEYAYFEAEGYCPGSGYLVSGDPNSGQIRNKLEFSRRTIVLEFVMQAGTSNVIFDWLEQATELSSKFTLFAGKIGATAYDHLAEVTIPQMQYIQIPIAADGDLITFGVTSQVFYNQAEGNPFVLRVQNSTPGYLAASAGLLEGPEGTGPVPEGAPPSEPPVAHPSRRRPNAE